MSKLFLSITLNVSESESDRLKKNVSDSKGISYYNDNLMVLIESLAAVGSGTIGFQRAKMGL